MKFKRSSIVMACLMATVAGSAMASSHREAPFITTSPKVDGTDFYMFSSYETGRKDYVTLIANYQPLQHPYGGPNYFSMDPNALYEIHIDNNGDAKEDITFQFRFKNTLNNVGVPTGLSKNTLIPLIQADKVKEVGDGNLNLSETYTVNVVRGDRRKGSVAEVVKASGGKTFEKPVDYIGEKTLGLPAAYEAYAEKHIHEIKIPGCATNAKVFVGQRQEGFAVNLGTVFDLVNEAPETLLNASFVDAYGKKGQHAVQQTNVTSIALEIPKSCLLQMTDKPDPVIGGWTTASLRQARLLNGNPGSGFQASEKAGGAWVQVSRLGNPLVNELVIGLPDKDKFNASKPSGDGQFAHYVTNPTLPKLLSLPQVLNNVNVIPKNTVRNDLANVFLTGIKGLNQPKNVVASEMLRLNTDIAPVATGQSRLGAGGSLATGGGTELAGFPNGRRPKDDVVDIALIATLGGLCALNGEKAEDKFGLSTFGGTTSAAATCNPESLNLPVGTILSIHDGVDQAEVPFKSTFPYLNTPNAGAKNPGSKS